MSIVRNVAGQTIYGVLVNAVDGSAITAGATITLSADGSAGAFGLGTLAHVASGLWKYTLTQAESNANAIGFVFGGTNVVPTGGLIVTQDFPRNALPPVAYTSPGGLLTSGAGPYQINPTGGVVPANVVQVAGATATAASGTAGAVTATSITLDPTNRPAVDVTGWLVTVVQATTGAYQSRVISAYDPVSGAATVPAWTVTPTGTVLYDLDPPGTASVSLGATAPAGWLNAAAFTAGSLNGKGDWPAMTGSLAAPRSLDAVADGAVTVSDALWCAVAAAAGRKDESSGTALVVQTPAGTATLRTFAVTTSAGVPVKVD